MHPILQISVTACSASRGEQELKLYELIDAY
jgi:hypothetical protein